MGFKTKVTVKVEEENCNRHSPLTSVPLDRAFLKAEDMVRDMCIEPDDGTNPYEIVLVHVGTRMRSTSFGDRREWMFEFEAECDPD